MKLVKNDVVDMDWDADGFIETKKLGFISAVKDYNGKAVAFRGSIAYTHVDDNGQVISFKDMVATIKKAVKSKDEDYPEYYEDYVELASGDSVEEDNLEALGLAEFEEDIVARVEDLSGYNVYIEKDSL